MGDNTHNEGGPMWDVDAGINGAWSYTTGRKNPASHDYSPPMTQAQMQAVLADCDTTEAVWLNAHPAPVKTWLNARTSGQRVSHKVGCLKTSQL
jgi:hypothetical protein